jgi:hypothetical protein
MRLWNFGWNSSSSSTDLCYHTKCRTSQPFRPLLDHYPKYLRRQHRLLRHDLNLCSALVANSSNERCTHTSVCSHFNSLHTIYQPRPRYRGMSFGLSATDHVRVAIASANTSCSRCDRLYTFARRAEVEESHVTSYMEPMIDRVHEASVVSP